MKKIFLYLLLGFVTFSCTNYEDDIKIAIQDYNTITPNTVETDLKVANIIVNQAEFDEMYTKFSESIEIKGFLNLYKNGETYIENEPIELQIKGTFSAKFGLKSLGVKFDATYNNEEKKLINPSKLPFHSFDKIKAFRFRNSGNDFESTMLKDMSYTKLVIEAGLNLDFMYAEQTIVFVNNTFLGLMNLRTEANTNGMSRLYNVSKRDITLAKIIEAGVVEKKDGDFDRIDNFISAINNEDYNYVSNEIDVDNFIDYMIFESYIGNIDWPKNNVRFFAINDGPFRFVLFDLDLVAIQNIDKSPFEFINHPSKNPITDLFTIMYTNEGFKTKFDVRFKELINSGKLSHERFNEIVTEYKNNIEHIMPLQINKYSAPKSFSKWYINIEHLKNNFKEREEFVKSSF